MGRVTMIDVNGSRETCLVCSGTPMVLVALRHPAMRQLTLDLLDRDHGCWRTIAGDGAEPLEAVEALHPDLVVLDAATFRSCECADGCQHPCGRMVVVGPEPDAAYRSAVLADGAGGWVARDDLAEQLSATMRRALGCTHRTYLPLQSSRTQGRPAVTFRSSPRCAAPQAERMIESSPSKELP